MGYLSIVGSILGLSCGVAGVIIGDVGLCFFGFGVFIFGILVFFYIKNKNNKYKSECLYR